MYSSLKLIGCGAIGSFFSKCLTITNLKKLILVDNDIVEPKNLTKSIFRKQDVGEYKVIAAKKILESYNKDLEIHPVIEKYSKKNIDADLTVDCRDVIVNRNSDIDCKLSISGRKMILDCRKNVNNLVERTGFYIEKVSKHDLQTATSKIVSIINHKLFSLMLKNEVVHSINMNDEIDSMFKSLKRSNENLDIVYENIQEISSRIYGFETFANFVLVKNKITNIIIFRSDNPVLRKEFQINSINNIYQLTILIKPLLQCEHCFFPNFIGENMIELIPSIGAA